MKKTDMANSDEEIFGYELLLDLYSCEPGVCDDLDLNYKFLDELPDFIGISKQTVPYIFRTPPQWKGKEGLSGFCPLVTSSLVTHTLTAKDYISLDIYSCRKFDIEKVKQFCVKFFHPKRIEEKFILRGEDYFK